ncbi:MAG: DUF2079 domain-containing protein [Bacteroidales bacterium]|nr:DUF2079 domain-containing protein [Bacteroidales bacterium]
MKSEKKILFIVVLTFGLIYSLVSLVNHFLFRTYALDLGLYNHAVYLFSRFTPAIYTLDITGNEMNFFATHWSPIIFLYVPFYYIFGSYTLLLIQVIAILAGGIGVYKYSQSKGLDSRVSIIILIFFYSIWGIFSALAFDFHNTVIAAMCLPWFIYFIDRGRKLQAGIFFLLIISAQENMALWMIFILVALLFPVSGQEKHMIRFKLILLILSLAWFIVSIEVLIPGLLPDEVPDQLTRYSHLGSSYGEILKNIVSDPVNTFKLLFINTTGSPVYSGIKSELHFMLLLSGGVALIFRPRYLIMLLPVYGQKLFSTDYALWGINYQYSIELVPLLALSVTEAILLIRNKRWRFISIIVITLVAMTATLIVTEQRQSKWYNRTNARFYHSEHYRSPYNRLEIMKGLDLVPENSIVSSSSELSPHLAKSAKLFLFPVINDAEYIVLLKNARSTYPLSTQEYLDSVSYIRDSGKYSVEYESEDLLVLISVVLCHSHAGGNP